MKKQLFLGLLAFGMLYSCQNEIVEQPISLDGEVLFARNSQTVSRADDICGDVQSNDIFAPGRKDVGQLEISNDEDNIYVDIDMENGYNFKSVRLYVGDCDAVPMNPNGFPLPSQFNYSEADAESVSNSAVRFVFAMTDVGNAPCISAEVKAKKKKSVKAWAFGEHQFNGPKEAWYTSYVAQECVEEEVFPNVPECGDVVVTNEPVIAEIRVSSSFSGAVPFTIYDEAGNALNSGSARFGRGGATIPVGVTLPYVGDYFIIFDFNGEQCYAGFFADQTIGG